MSNEYFALDANVAALAQAFGEDMGDVKRRILKDATTFPTRTEMVAALPSLSDSPDGRIVFANGDGYMRDRDSSAIPDMPGWKRWEPIPGVVNASDIVSYGEQFPNPAKQAQARQNLGLGTASVRDESYFATATDAAFKPYADRATAEAANVPPYVDRIGVFAPNGDTLWYKRDAAGTALVTSDGAKWSPDGYATPEHFGIGTGNVSSDTESMQSFLEHVASGNVGRADGVYTVHDTLEIPGGADVRLTFGTESALTFVSAGVSAPLSGCLTIGADDGYTVLPGLSEPIAGGDTSVTFSTTPPLERGDVFIVYNDDEGSWGDFPSRPYYRRGDYLRVTHRIGSVVYLQTAAAEDYSLSENLRNIKLTTSRVDIRFLGKVIGSPGVRSNAIFAHNVISSRFSFADADGFGASVLNLSHPYDTLITDTWIGTRSQQAGTGYGVSIIGGYNTRVTESSIYSMRHAVTLTGGGVTAGIPSRLCGAINCTLTGDEVAADMHGSVDGCFFQDCTIIGGAYLSGKNGRIIGGSISTVSATTGDAANVGGVAVRLRETLNADHRVIGTTIYHNHDLTPEAVSNGYGLFTLRYDAQHARSGFDASGLTLVSDVDVVSDPGLLKPQMRLQYSAGFAGASVKVSGVRSSGNVIEARVITAATSYLDLIQVEKGLSVNVNMDAQAKSYVVDDVRSDNAGAGGITIQLSGDDLLDRSVRVSNSEVTRSPAQGIFVICTGTVSTGHYVELLGNKSVNNNESGSGSVNRRAGIVVESLDGPVVVRGNTLGDTRAVPLQDHTLTAVNCPQVYEVDNVKVGAGALRTSNSTINSSIPNLS